MRRRNRIFKSMTAMFLVLVMCLGMLPAGALASGAGDGTVQAMYVAGGHGFTHVEAVERRSDAAYAAFTDGRIITDDRDTGVNVTYASVHRDIADITYTVPGRGAGVHVIALVDVSIDNRDALGAVSEVLDGCERLRYGRGSHDSGTTARTIAYQNTARDVTDVLNGTFSRAGYGQSNPAAGLDSVLEALDSVPDGQMPVLFWVLSPAGAIEAAGRLDETRAKLEEVREKLAGMGGELITWQLGSEASGWLAGENTRVNCAAGGEFRTRMRDSLESVVCDGIEDFRITLSLPGGGLATGIRKDGITIRRVCADGRHDAFETFGVSGGGQSVTVEVPKLYDSVEDIEITFPVDLDTALNVKETIGAPSVGGTYRLGVFDESAVDYPAFKAAELDRTQRAITFKASADAGEDRTKQVKGLPGESVLVPDGSEWNDRGMEFSGWTYDGGTGTYVRPGEEMKIPEEDAVLTALWGHVGLELLLGNVERAPEPGNRMYPGTDTSVSWSGFLSDLKNKFEDDLGVGWTTDIVSVAVVDGMAVRTGNLLDAVTVHGGIRCGKQNGVYIGLDGKNPVVAYVLESADHAGKYDLYLAGPDGVTAPYSLSGLFGSMVLEKADLELLDTSIVTDMRGMFASCSNLTGLDLGSFDTSGVTDMNQMFYYCSSLAGLDVGGWDTLNVTDMRNMFYYCSQLTSLDVSRWNTSSVTDMSSMFGRCPKLAGLDVSRWGTSNVTGMGSMFYGCSKLADLDVSNWDTSNVTGMGSMFSGCSSLTSLDVSGWDTSNVTGMDSMFSGCSKLASLDVSGFDTSKVTAMDRMFYDCRGLASLDVSRFDTSKVTAMDRMFYNCSGLTSLNVGGFRTSNVTDMRYMFYSCKKLTGLDVSGFDTSKVTDMYGMFSYCSGLTSLNVSGFDTSNVATMNSMFSYCSKLTSLGVSGFDTSKATDTHAMFQGCSGLTGLDVSGWDTSRVTDVGYMFFGCSKLKTITFGNSFYLPTAGAASFYAMFSGCSVLQSVSGIKWNTGACETPSLSNMFNGCAALASVDLSAPEGKNFPKLGDLTGMFNGCTSLTSVDLSGWSVPNLSKMSTMFANTGSKSLTIDMSWNNLTGTQMTLTDILQNRTGAITLKIGSYVNDGSSTYTQKTNIINAFKEWKNKGYSLTIRNSSGGLVASAMTPMLLASADQANPVYRLLASTARANAVDKEDIDYGQKVPTYKYSTPVDSTVSYIVRINYAGDGHAESGMIDIRYPLPEGVVPNRDVDGADLIDVGRLEFDNGTSVGSNGNLVTGKVFRLEGSDADGYVLVGSVRGIPAGAHMDVSVNCVLDELVDSTKETVGTRDYWYWTGTAYAGSGGGSVVSNPLRLWYSRGDAATPAQPDKARVVYRFTGDVPFGAVPPEAGLGSPGATVTMPAVAVPDGYVFDGWYREDTGSPVNSYTVKDTDVASGVTFWGRWRLEDGTGSIGLTYKYEAAGGEVPDGLRDYLVSTELRPGVRCGIMVPEPVFGYGFAGWHTVTVDGVRDDTFPKEGILDTTGLAFGSRIVYIGSWTPHTGTIRFDANGADGEGPTDMSVKIAAPEGTLPGAGGLDKEGHEFHGWSVAADGSGTVYPAGTPVDGLVGEGKPLSGDGGTITLYAVWKARIGYEFPDTGGTGTVPYTVTGFSIVLLAGFLLIRRRKYRQAG